MVNFDLLKVNFVKKYIEIILVLECMMKFSQIHVFIKKNNVLFQYFLRLILNKMINK